MSNSHPPLKPGWKWVKFGDVARQVKDKVDPETSGLERYIAGDHMDTDDLRIRRWGEIGSGYLGPAFHMRFLPGHVLYGSRRTYLRKVAVADFTGITANTTFVIESRDSSILLPEFLPLVMQTENFHAHSIKQSKGSVNPYINFTDLVWFEFPLPPIDEQYRICELLLSAQSLKDDSSGLVESIQLLREALAIEAWGGKSNLETLLGTLCEKIQDGTHFSPKTSAGEFRYITSKNIRDGYLDLSCCGWISREEHDEIYKRCSVRLGDILLTKDGANTGNVAINSIEEPFSLLSSVALIRPSEGLNHRYLFEFLRSKIGKQRIVSMMSGTAIPRVTLQKINRISIPVIPLDKQEELASQFLEIENALIVAQTRQERSKILYRNAVAKASIGD